MKLKTIAAVIALIPLIGSAQQLPSQGGGYAHFSFALNNATNAPTSQPAYAVDSVQYSTQVSGQALNKGVTLHTTQGVATVLITRAQSKGAPATALDTSKLRLVNPLLNNLNVVDKSRSEQQMAQSGVFSHTLALTTSSKTKGGSLRLTTSQPLASSDLYRVTVREKDSMFKLHMGVTKQSFTADEDMLATANMNENGVPINVSSAIAKLVDPEGKSYPINLDISADGIIKMQAKQTGQFIPPSQGLYEIHLKTTGKSNGQVIERDAKLALGMVNSTAKINFVTVQVQNGLSAQVDFTANQASRFEVRAVLFGTNEEGQLVPVMESQAADNVAAGRSSISLPFDSDIIEKASVTAPYRVGTVELFDQKQLGLVDSYINQPNFSYR